MLKLRQPIKIVNGYRTYLKFARRHKGGPRKKRRIYLIKTKEIFGVHVLPIR